MGRKCLLQLLQHSAYIQVVALMEEPLRFEHHRLAIHEVSYERLPETLPEGPVHDVYYCWDGTSQPIKAERDKFDPAATYAAILAREARDRKAGQFMYLSSVGADTSSTLYYRQEKRMVEQYLEDLDFWAVHLFRPALITDENATSPEWARRSADWLGRSLSTLTGGVLGKYRPVDGLTVAKAMVQAAQRFQSGVHVYSSEYLQELAKSLDKGLIRRNGK